MNGHLHDSRNAVPRHRGWSIALAVAALASAAAAITTPGFSGISPGIFAILAVGAIAVLAGHSWGLSILGVADVLFVGKLWPHLAVVTTHDISGAGTATLVTTLALAAAIPGVILFVATLPRTVALLLGKTDGTAYRAGIAVSGFGALVWLAAPAIPPAMPGWANGTARAEQLGHRGNSAGSRAPERSQPGPERGGPLLRPRGLHRRAAGLAEGTALGTVGARDLRHLTDDLARITGAGEPRLDRAAKPIEAALDSGDLSAERVRMLRAQTPPGAARPAPLPPTTSRADPRPGRAEPRGSGAAPRAAICSPRKTAEPRKATPTTRPQPKIRR